MRDFATDLAEARFARFANLLMDVESAIALLPPEERAEYKRCQQSIVDAAIWLRPPGC